MQAIQKIIEFLDQYPWIKYEQREDAIRVYPSSENGFEVALLVSAESYTVSYAFWHTEFSDEQMAIEAFKNGLSDAFRLRVSSRGGVDYFWRIEFREGDDWISGSAVCIFRFPFWKKKTIRYLQNDYFLANAKECGGPGFSEPRAQAKL